MAFAMNDRPLVKSTLLKNIQTLRDQLVHSGVYEGLDNEKTIHLSQKLDKYIYLYQSFDKLETENLLP
jgi:uncharacterized protein YutE (UPF0331/DUF86 family)